MAEGWGLVGEADAAKKFLDVRFHAPVPRRLGDLTTLPQLRKSLGEHALLRVGIHDHVGPGEPRFGGEPPVELRDRAIVPKAWRAEFWSPKRAELVIETHDRVAISIRDTRACAVARQ